jgi:hypothetical protein
MSGQLRKQCNASRSPAGSWWGHALCRRLLLGYEVVVAVLVGLALSGGVAFADVTVSPTAPPGADALQDLINWGGYTGAATCLGGAIYGFGKMGLAHKDGNYGASNHGRTVAMMSLAGALGLGVAPTVINTLTAIH